MKGEDAPRECPSADELDGEQLLGWIEFGCWSALAMAPVIYWLQGPSVSHDQYVVRIGLVVVAALGGVFLRIRAIVRQRKHRRSSEAG